MSKRFHARPDRAPLPSMPTTPDAPVPVEVAAPADPVRDEPVAPEPTLPAPAFVAETLVSAREDLDAVRLAALAQAVESGVDLDGTIKRAMSLLAHRIAATVLAEPS